MSVLFRARRTAAIAALLTVAVIPATAAVSAPRPNPASVAAAAAYRVSVTSPAYDAPGAVIPIVVTVTGVPASTPVSFSVPGGWCRPAPQGQWRHAAGLSSACYVALPRRAWHGRISAAALVGRGAAAVGVSGTTDKVLKTVGAPSATMTPAQIERIEHCGNTTAQVWLTFDDYLRSPAATRDLLATLARNHVRAHFYLNRLSAGDRQLLLRAGHVVQNHTKDHLALTGLSTSKIRSEIKGGPAPSVHPFSLRPPYGAGAFSTAVAAAAAPLGYAPCRWTVDSRDWAGDSAAQMGAAVRYGNTRTPPVYAGGVILMHANHATPAKVQAVINAIRARGLIVEPGR